MNRLIATAFILGTFVTAANALPLAPVAPVSDSNVIGGGRRMRRRLLSWSL